MKPNKTYFYQIITTMKIPTLALSFIVITLITSMITTSPIYAEEAKAQVKQVVTCETMSICEQFQETIQAQLDEFETKGIENLSDDEFIKYASLTDDLIAIENEKQKAQDSLIDAIDKTDAQISRLRGTLLEN